LNNTLHTLIIVNLGFTTYKSIAAYALKNCLDFGVINKLDLDKNRYFGNVEKAMLLLSKKKYANKALFGYVRSIQKFNIENLTGNTLSNPLMLGTYKKSRSIFIKHNISTCNGIQNSA